MKKESTKKKSDLYGHNFMIGFGAVMVLMLSGIFYVAFTHGRALEIQATIFVHSTKFNKHEERKD